MMTTVRARVLLEVDADASWSVIRQSYRDLVRVWHPDRFEADPRLRAKAEQRVAHVTEAYRHLERERHLAPTVPSRPVAAREVRVQASVPVPPARGRWSAPVMIAVALAIALTAVAMPRRVSAPMIVAEAPVAAPAIPTPPAAPSAPVVAHATRTPAVVHARSFVARETDRVLAAR